MKYLAAFLFLVVFPLSAGAEGRRFEFHPHSTDCGGDVARSQLQAKGTPQATREYSDSEWIIWTEQCICRARLKADEGLLTGKNIVCSFIVSKTGVPSDLRIEKTSGTHVSDEEVLGLIKSAGPFPAYSSGVQRRVLAEFSDVPKTRARLVKSAR